MPGARRAISLFWVGAVASLLSARAAGAIEFTFATPIRGDSLAIRAALAEAPGGDAVELEVSIPAGEGELLGVFGNLVRASLVPELRVEAAPGVVADSRFEVDGVTALGPGNTLAPVVGWDWAVRLGPGEGPSARESARLKLRAPGLRLADLLGGVNEGWVLGVRVQNTRGDEGWAKIGLSERAPILLQIESPAPGSAVAGSSVDVSGAAGGEEIASVVVNGREAEVAGGRFEALAVELLEGDNTIRVTATNPFGSASERARVVLDETPPELALRAPSEGTLTGDETIEVSGTARDESGVAEVRVNGVAAELADGRFRARVPLALGGNRIEVEAADVAGRRVRREVVVTRGERPAIVIEEPVHRALLRPGRLAVSGAVAGSPVPEVVVNGVAARVEEGQFRAEVVLGDGPLTLTATATNSVGESHDEIRIEGGSPPRIEVSQPADGALVNDNVVEVRGAVSGVGALELDANDVPVGIADGRFGVWVPLEQEGENAIVLTARNALGPTRETRRVVRDTTPPELALAPPAAALVADEELVLSGTLRDANALRGVTANGVTGELSDGGFRVRVPLALGPNRIAVEATDRAGNRASAAVEVRRGARPEVAIDDPIARGVVPAGEVEVSGRVAGSPPPQVSVNGVSATLRDGGFRARVPVAAGAATLVAVATNALGEARVEIPVTGGLPPSIQIAAPTEGARVRATPLEVRGPVSGTGTVAVDVNGVRAQVQDGEWSARVPLVEGENRLVATALNLLGETKAERSLVLDTRPPEIALQAPEPGALTAAAEVEVLGSVRDAGPVAGVTVNGAPAQLADGAFRARVALAPGDNAIAVAASDAAGNSATRKLSLTRGAPPTLAIDAPAEGGIVSARGVEVRLRAQGLPAPEVVVNGVAARAAEGVWTAQVPLEEGANALVATARNPLGQATASVAVRRDTLPPALTLSAPAPGALVADATVEVAGSVSDTGAIRELSVAGRPVTPVDGAFSARVPLQLGANQIPIAATDVAGNSATLELALSRGAAPTLAIETPAEGALLAAAELEVSGRAGGLPAPAVAVNGVPASVADGAFRARVPLAEGANRVDVTAQNPLGDARAARSVVRDSRGPELTATSAVERGLTAEPSIEISGRVGDPSGVRSVTVNGVPTPVADGAFRARAALGVGANAIGVEAVDAAGNTSSTVLEITRGEPPRLSLEAPAAGSTLAAGEVEVRGAIAGFPTPQVSVAGVPAMVASGKFRARVPLAEGARTLVATARNPLGEASAELALVGATPPALEITSPAEGAIERSSPARIRGKVSGSAAQVEVNGVPAAVEAGGFSADVPLAEGANQLVAIARNALGEARDAQGVVLDTRPPAVTIEAPVGGALLSEPRVVVSGRAEDASPIVGLRLNGRPLPAGTSFRDAVELAPGANEIAVAAEDAAGNVGRASVGVRLEVPPPPAPAPPPLAPLGPPAPLLAPAPAPGATPAPAVAPEPALAAEPAPAPAESAPVPAPVIPPAPVVPPAPPPAPALAPAAPGEPLRIAITATIQGSAAAQPTVVVAGTVSDPAARVTVNGVDAAMTGRSWTVSVPLTEGPNRVNAVATRGAESASATTTVIRELVPALPPPPPLAPPPAP